MYPELKWSEETYMLWRIEHQLRSLAWGLSDKKHRPPQEPQPLNRRRDGGGGKQRRKGNSFDGSGHKLSLIHI